MHERTDHVPSPVHLYQRPASLSGGIAAYRIRLWPPPGEATEEDVLAVKAHEGHCCELIDGILVAKDMAAYESRLAVILGYFLELFLENNALEVVLGPDGMLREYFQAGSRLIWVVAPAVRRVRVYKRPRRDLIPSLLLRALPGDASDSYQNSVR